MPRGIPKKKRGGLSLADLPMVQINNRFTSLQDQVTAVARLELEDVKKLDARIKQLAEQVGTVQQDVSTLQTALGGAIAGFDDRFKRIEKAVSTLGISIVQVPTNKPEDNSGAPASVRFVNRHFDLIPLKPPTEPAVPTVHVWNDRVNKLQERLDASQARNAELVIAARQVTECWEGGDLAQAVRNLDRVVRS